MIGAKVPALPGVSIGHNGPIAFGYTIFTIDQEDLYVYDLNPENLHQYRYQNRWEPFRVVRETVEANGRAPVPADLAFTRHGPVIFTDEQIIAPSPFAPPGLSPACRRITIRCATCAQKTSLSSRGDGVLVRAEVQSRLCGRERQYRLGAERLGTPPPELGRLVASARRRTLRMGGSLDSRRTPRIYHPATGTSRRRTK